MPLPTAQPDKLEYMATGRRGAVALVLKILKGSLKVGGSPRSATFAGQIGGEERPTTRSLLRWGHALVDELDHHAAAGRNPSASQDGDVNGSPLPQPHWPAIYAGSTS